MSAGSLDSREYEILLEDKERRESVVHYLGLNGEATSEEIRGLAGESADSWDRGEYVAVARSLNELGYVESEINNGEMVWTTDEDFSYNSVLEEVEEALENHERQGH